MRNSLSTRTFNTLRRGGFFSFETVFSAYINNPRQFEAISGYGEQTDKEVRRWLGLPVPVQPSRRLVGAVRLCRAYGYSVTAPSGFQELEGVK